MAALPEGLILRGSYVNPPNTKGTVFQNMRRSTAATKAQRRRSRSGRRTWLRGWPAPVQGGRRGKR